jgi:hypothetical protein
LRAETVAKAGAKLGQQGTALLVTPDPFMFVHRGLVIRHLYLPRLGWEKSETFTVRMPNKNHIMRGGVVV